jgi:hypothetical protein
MAQRRTATMIDVFAPQVALIAKLGSILVHVEEGLSDGGHHFDWTATRSLLADREVQQWIEGLRAQALVPVKRT